VTLPPRLLLIVNPVASGVGPRSERDAIEAMSPFATVEVVHTQHGGHAAELAQAAADAGFDAVVVLAGDGTVNEVLGAVGVRVPVGALPAGGTSVLARALGLGRSVADAAREVALAARDGRVREIALGSLAGRVFAFNAGIGIDADVVRRIDSRGRAHGRRPGDAAFAFEAARALASRRYSHPLLSVEVAGRAPLRGTSVLAANNAPWSFAGPFALQVAPRARFELGIDVAVPADLRARRLPGIGRALVSGRHAGGQMPGLAYLHDVDQVHVRSDEPLPAQVDGEDLGDLSEAVLRVVRPGARMLVPRIT